MVWTFRIPNLYSLPVGHLVCLLLTRRIRRTRRTRRTRSNPRTRRTRYTRRNRRTRRTRRTRIKNTHCISAGITKRHH